MNNKRVLVGSVALAGALGLLAGCETFKGMKEDVRGATNTQSVTLSGANEVPAVMSSASGSGSITVNPDRSVVGNITVKGMTATAAHIHEGAAGSNGGVIVPFVKQGDNYFVAPPGAKLTDAQYDAYKAGRTYVNVHSAAHPGGEVRAQLKGY
jgi:hypothetical protein